MKYVTILTKNESVDHEWNGNEEKGKGNHSGVLRLSDSVKVRLHWAKNINSPRHYVGSFQLFLNQLLNDGYIAKDPQEGCIRLKFVNVDGVIRVATGKRSRKYLVIGDFKS